MRLEQGFSWILLDRSFTKDAGRLIKTGITELIKCIWRKSNLYIRKEILLTNRISTNNEIMLTIKPQMRYWIIIHIVILVVEFSRLSYPGLAHKLVNLHLLNSQL